jgi:uroporphyrinogen-III synthase
MSRASLAGKRILVTRAKEQAKVLSEYIIEAGGTPVEVPLLSFQRVSDEQKLEEAISSIKTFSWLIFTSANGVHFFMERFLQQYGNLQRSNLPRIAVVGTKTAKALTRFDLEAELLPDQFIAERLADTLKEDIKDGEHVLIARGNLARPVLTKELQEHGIKVNDIIVYQTVLPETAHVVLKEITSDSENQIDVATFTSSSTVRHYVKLLNELGMTDQCSKTAIACIGPVTAKTARELGLAVDIIPEAYTVEGLVHAICTYYGGGK